MPSALPKMKKYTWYLSMQLNVNRKDYVEKIVLRVEISSFSRVSPEIITDAFKFVLTFMPNSIDSDSLRAWIISGSESG